jgi:hypothetical protein
MPSQLVWGKSSLFAMSPNHVWVYDIELIDVAREASTSLKELRRKMNYAEGYSVGEELESMQNVKATEQSINQFLDGVYTGLELEELKAPNSIDSFFAGGETFKNAILSKEEIYVSGLYFGSDVLRRTGISLADFDFKVFGEACYLAFRKKEAQFTEEEMGTFRKDYLEAKNKATQESKEK